MLAGTFVVLGTTWAEERDLSQRLTVYRSVDSLVEFFVPLTHQPADTNLLSPPLEGFTYQNTYYEVVRLEVVSDSIHLLAYAKKDHRLWPRDLLALIKQEVTGDAGTTRKTHHLLSHLFTDYMALDQTEIPVLSINGPTTRRFAATARSLPDRQLPIHSPPPELV